ncbi:DUF3540 domain-containing protein [Variovorax paradoxus]|uniref:DUF3540 domain-containing protein n=1 Tax=Variovorax paradoxus TaxID=34073 RepID=UPI0019332B2D|nr:DUF3540 domain-containing protein [Variovorax paradoxus]
MNVVALRSPATAASVSIHLLGKVLACEPHGAILVEDEGGGQWTCRRAASCLLQPAPGDTVLFSGPDAQRVFLIAVVEQADPRASRIEVPGDLVLSAPGGSIAVDSATDLRLHSAGKLDMAGAQWQVRAEQAQLQVAEMRYVGQAVDATVGRVRLLGKLFETMADRLLSMARSTLRVVDETEQVRVGHLDCEASHAVRIHGHHTVVTGKELVKVDAAQIHMG